MWVGQAWEEVSTSKDMIIRSFQKGGISVAVDGSQDSQIDILQLDRYEVGYSDSEPEHSRKFSKHVPHGIIICQQTHLVSVVSVAVFVLQN